MSLNIQQLNKALANILAGGQAQPQAPANLVAAAMPPALPTSGADAPRNGMTRGEALAKARAAKAAKQTVAPVAPSPAVTLTPAPIAGMTPEVQAVLMALLNQAQVTTPAATPAVDVVTEIARLKAENAALRNGKPKAQPSITFRVSEKGAVSVYGLGRFPVTLYRTQWESLFNSVDAIKAFIRANESKLAMPKNG